MATNENQRRDFIGCYVWQSARSRPTWVGRGSVPVAALSQWAHWAMFVNKVTCWSDYTAVHRIRSGIFVFRAGVAELVYMHYVPLFLHYLYRMAENNC